MRIHTSTRDFGMRINKSIILVTILACIQLGYGADIVSIAESLVDNLSGRFNHIYIDGYESGTKYRYEECR